MFLVFDFFFRRTCVRGMNVYQELQVQNQCKGYSQGRWPVWRRSKFKAIVPAGLSFSIAFLLKVQKNGSVALVSPGSLLETQNLEPHLRYTES